VGFTSAGAPSHRSARPDVLPKDTQQDIAGRPGIVCCDNGLGLIAQATEIQISLLLEGGRVAVPSAERLPALVRRTPLTTQQWRAAPSAVEMRNEIEVEIAIIEVDLVAGHIEPEDGQVQVVEAEGISSPSSLFPGQVQARERETHAAGNNQVARGDRFAGEAWVIGLEPDFGKEVHDA
jgi:hypothetical protein